MSDVKQAPVNAVHAYMANPGTMPLGSALTVASKHGGLETLFDPASNLRRLQRVPGLASDGMAREVAATVPDFFYKLVATPYPLDPALIALIAAPDTGLVFNTGNQSSPNIPAAFTFVGQFIDHDLTMNAMNLFAPQTQLGIRDGASPLLDLDSVYGPRVDIDPQSPTAGKVIETSLDPATHRFILNPIQGAVDPNSLDVPRTLANDPDTGTQVYQARIGDKRNDENQIILQIHMVIMRLHNRFMEKFGDFDTAKRETIRHWQSFVATEYLPVVARQDEIDRVMPRLGKAGPSGPLHGPALGSTTLHQMPHEFAIGFRFGHSQLRSAYAVQSGHSEVPLFDGTKEGLYDLRGSKALASDHVIEWPYFLPVRSNLIDAKVNQVVFNLPPSTIPDHVKTELNLPKRNLDRSNSIQLCAGEDLLSAYNQRYGSPDIAAVPESLINPNNSPLFTKTGTFRTPLWYYLLREAERDRGADGTDGHLGHLGSRLVAEVILSAIYYEPNSILKDAGWHAKIPTTSGRPRSVAFTDILKFVGLV